MKHFSRALGDADGRSAEQSRKTPPQGMRVGQPFNPFKLFTGIFVPEAIVRYQGLSCGAKVTYGRLARYAGENGKCFPSIPTLATEIGLSAAQARTYVHELRDQRFIAIEPRPGTSGVVTFLWHEAFAGDIGEKRKTPPLRKTRPLPLRKTGPLPLRKTKDEENHHQESQKKESQKPGEDSGKQAIPTAPPNLPPSQGKTNSLSLKADDENPKPDSALRLAFDDPREELRARVCERHPGADPEYVLECLARELASKNLGLTEFLEFDASCTTNPHIVKNPAGYYRDLAKRLNAQLEAAAFEERRKLNDRVDAFLSVPEPEKSKGPKCPICHEIEGKGIMLSADKKGIEPCSCATAEFAAEFRQKEAARRNRTIQEAVAKENADENIADDGVPHCQRGGNHASAIETY